MKHEWDEICTKVESVESDDVSALNQIEKDLNNFSAKLTAETAKLKDLIVTSQTDLENSAIVESTSSDILQEWNLYHKSLETNKAEADERINSLLEDKLESLKQQMSANDLGLKNFENLSLADQNTMIQVTMIVELILSMDTI